MEELRANMWWVVRASQAARSGREMEEKGQPDCSEILVVQAEPLYGLWGRACHQAPSSSRAHVFSSARVFPYPPTLQRIRAQGTPSLELDDAVL